MEYWVWRRKSPSGHRFLVSSYLLFIWSCLLPRIPNKTVANKINMKQLTYLVYGKCSPMTHGLNDGKPVLLRDGRTFSSWGLLKGSEVLVGEPLKGALRAWHHLSFSLLSCCTLAWGPCAKISRETRNVNCTGLFFQWKRWKKLP